MINIGRIAVADSILISDGSTFISFCSLSHHLSFSVCICLLHSLRRRSSRANRARNLAQGGCPDGCRDADGKPYCESADCQGCSECHQTGPPGTSGEGTARLIHVCRWLARRIQGFRVAIPTDQYWSELNRRPRLEEGGGWVPRSIEVLKAIES